MELSTDPPQLTYVNFAHIQGEIPVDRQLAAQLLEGFQDSTALTLSKLSHKEQRSLCEQLQFIRDQLAQTSLILDMMDQCDEAHDEQLKSFKHTGESVI
jgi:dTDP-D-glucose 4,6-dehydratase